MKAAIAYRLLAVGFAQVIFPSDDETRARMQR